MFSTDSSIVHDSQGGIYNSETLNQFKGVFDW